MPTATIHGLAGIHREELMDVMIQLQTLNGGLLADNKGLRECISKLKREIEAHKRNALELAHQLDQMKRDYWALADSKAEQKEPPSKEIWPAVFAALACVAAGALGCVWCGGAL